MNKKELSELDIIKHNLFKELRTYCKTDDLALIATNTSMQFLEKYAEKKLNEDAGFETVKRLAKQVRELKNALDTAVTGLEWWNDSYPDGSSPTDDEHIEKFKSLIKNKNQ